MRWLVLVVLVSGWAWAGWRNAPPVVHADPMVFALAIAASCVVAWWTGRRSGRSAAVAVAMARADARAAALARSHSASTSTAAVVVNVDTGARSVGARQLGGLDAAPWIGAPVALVEQDSEQMAAEELMDAYEGTEVHESA